jgi:hypothetical protein
MDLCPEELRSDPVARVEVFPTVIIWDLLLLDTAFYLSNSDEHLVNDTVTFIITRSRHMFMFEGLR